MSFYFAINIYDRDERGKWKIENFKLSLGALTQLDVPELKLPTIMWRITGEFEYDKRVEHFIACLWTQKMGEYVKSV